MSPTATLRQDITISGKPPQPCYEAALAALTDSGFVVWKARPLVWFVIANREAGGRKTQANVSVRPGKDVAITVSVSGDADQEEELDRTLAGIAAEIQTRLESGRT